MAYDTELADRMREVMSAQPAEWRTKAMFGGLAFLVEGHMVIAVSGQGGLLLRADPEVIDDLRADPRISPSVMGGRSMTGWLHVDLDAGATDEELAGWIDQAVGFVATL